MSHTPHVDAEAWKNNPEHRFVYNKLWLCESQNIECAPAPVKPDNYPVFYKPIYNLFSLGSHAFRADNPVSEDRLHPGMFWMEYLDGTHWTIDGEYKNGRITKTISFRCVKRDNDLFDYFEPYRPDFEPIKYWLDNRLDGYEGPVNLEGIGDKVIECHLRNSHQLQKTNSGIGNAKDYIVPVFGEYQKYRYSDILAKDIKKSHKNCRIFITIENGMPEQSLNGYGRLGYIISPDLEKGKKVRDKLINKAFDRVAYD